MTITFGTTHPPACPRPCWNAADRPGTDLPHPQRNLPHPQRKRGTWEVLAGNAAGELRFCLLPFALHHRPCANRASRE